MSIIKGFLDGLRPEPRLTVSEWSDRYRILAPTASAEPGSWRTARTPYLKEIQDKLSSGDPVQEVIFMKGAQIGATEAGNNWIGYIIDSAPAPTLMVMPTDDTVKRNSKIRIDPMVEATPRLREKIAPSRARDGDNTTRSKSFPGGVLVMTGANSAVGLRSMPVRYLFLDEVDAYPIDLDGEGAPVDLARARTRTFAKKKIFLVSTPTIEGRSVIEREFKLTDQRRFFVPCPHCGTMQVLRWSQVKWEKDKPQTAKYECEHCQELIEERYKTAMLSSGEWVATVPENVNPSKVGYHINALYSPFGWYSWAEAASDWIDGQKDVNKLKTFVNTVLGETWAEKGEAPAYMNLYNRRRSYERNRIPRDVSFITVGVDVQKDRLELEVVGWCKHKITYSIDYRVIMGDTTKSDAWLTLGKVVNESWEREDGLTIPMHMMAVDTGYNTSHVYDFVRSFDPSRVIPIKGDDRLQITLAPPKSVDISRDGKKIGKLGVWRVGVSILKSELYGWLRQEISDEGLVPDGYCYHPEYDQQYFRGLTAEELQFKIDRKGFKVYEWVKKYDRNEPLDCRIYARAAAAVVGIDRFKDEHYDILAGNTVDAKKVVAPKRKSSYWDK